MMFSIAGLAAPFGTRLQRHTEHSMRQAAAPLLGVACSLYSGVCTTTQLAVFHHFTQLHSCYISSDAGVKILRG